MKILVIGFAPLVQEDINPVFDAVKRLDDYIDGIEIIKLRVPMAFNACVEQTCEKIKEVNPDVVLSIGQAGGRAYITVDRVAINLNDARVPDSLKYQPIDEVIDENGEAAYFVTIPVKEIVEGIRKEKIPAGISNTTGTFVCNHLLYGVLNYICKNNLNIKAGFIHIPFILEQVVDKPKMIAMSLDDIVRAIEVAIKVIGKNEESIRNLEFNTSC